MFVVKMSDSCKPYIWINLYQELEIHQDQSPLKFDEPLKKKKKKKVKARENIIRSQLAGMEAFHEVCILTSLVSEKNKYTIYLNFFVA